MSFEEFQDGRHGGHLGYRNGTVLAILTLYVATMRPTKFQLSPTCEMTCESGDVEKVKRRTTDGRTTDNRPGHKMTWSKAPDELIKYVQTNIVFGTGLPPPDLLYRISSIHSAEKYLPNNYQNPQNSSLLTLIMLNSAFKQISFIPAVANK